MNAFRIMALLAGAALLSAQEPVPPAIAESDRLMANNRPDAAIELLLGEIQKNPRDEALQVALGMIYAGEGRFPEAVNTFEKVLTQDPQSVAALVGLGRVHLAKGERAAASQAIRKAAEASVGNPGPLINYSATFEQGRSLELSEMIDEELLRVNPGDPVLSNNLAYVLAEQDKDLDRALQLAQVAIRELPNAIPIIDTLGWVYYRLGRLDDALPKLCRSLASEVDSQVYQRHVLKVLDSLPRLNRDQLELRDWLRADDDPERYLRLQELASVLSN